MSPESLAIKLRQARAAMSLEEAAEQSEIPAERIRMYEEGVRRPYGKTLRRLADVYGVRVAELAGSGPVVRARSRGPAVRRRRRRIVAPVTEGIPIAVPLEVAEGQTVRLVIELFVRRREDQGPVEEAESAERAPARGEEAAAEPLRDVARPHGGGQAVGGGAPDSLRRPRLLEQPAREPRDPIIELKRAYRDFRHKKP